MSDAPPPADVRRQAHYTACGIEPMDFIVAAGMDFLEGNVVKYLARYRRKGGLEDLRKARAYLDVLIAREEGKPGWRPSDTLRGA